MNHEPRVPDRSNGYDTLAGEFIASRTASKVGVATVRAWSRTLSASASILDVGCGNGTPISRALRDDGFVIYGVDASAAMVQAFRNNLPGCHVSHEAAEESRFFDRTFDAAIAWGLMFLLSAEVQEALLHRIAAALKPDARLLFTSPATRGNWADLLTGRPSLSLGADRYVAIMSNAGLKLVNEYDDEGDNHYYDALKPRG